MILALHLSLGQLKKRGEGGFKKRRMLSFKSKNIEQNNYMLMLGVFDEM